jgi:hypothetical protein
MLGRLDPPHNRNHDRRMRRWAVCLLALALTSLHVGLDNSDVLSAQTAGNASFVVYEKGQQTGTLDTRVTQTADGWRIDSSMQTKGRTPIHIVRLELLYDRNWFGRWMTMEMKQPDDVIVHVAVSRTTAHTDVVYAREARFRSTSVSRDTVLLPERAYGAYEALAARLDGGAASDLPLFVPPLSETRVIVESVARERVRTAAGDVSAQHYVLTGVGIRPTRADLWTNGGRMLRLDLPGAQISVVRADVER